MHLGKTLFVIQILVSKFLCCISFLLFTQTFFNHGKETFLISLTLLVVQHPISYGLTIILQLLTTLLPLKNFRVAILALSISYLHLRENLKTGITSKENFNSPIPEKWKQILRENRADTCVIYLNHHLVKNSLLLSLEKLTSGEKKKHIYFTAVF